MSIEFTVRMEPRMIKRTLFVLSMVGFFIFSRNNAFSGGIQYQYLTAGINYNMMTTLGSSDGDGFDEISFPNNMNYTVGLNMAIDDAFLILEFDPLTAVPGLWRRTQPKKVERSGSPDVYVSNSDVLHVEPGFFLLDYKYLYFGLGLDLDWSYISVNDSRSGSYFRIKPEYAGGNMFAIGLTPTFLCRLREDGLIILGQITGQVLRSREYEFTVKGEFIGFGCVPEVSILYGFFDKFALYLSGSYTYQKFEIEAMNDVGRREYLTFRYRSWNIRCGIGYNIL